MGMDFLDLTLRVEDKHGLALARFDEQPSELAEEYRRAGEMRDRSLLGIPIRRWDIRVGKLYAFLQPQFRPGCRKCQRILESPTNPAWCPECGRRIAWSELAWESFQEALAETVGKKVEEIQHDTWLMGDLGFSY